MINLNHDNATIKLNWLPNVDGDPGFNFFVKYRIKELPTWYGSNRYRFFVMVSDLKSNNMYEIIVVSLDGEYMTESGIQEVSISAYF